MLAIPTHPIALQPNHLSDSGGFWVIGLVVGCDTKSQLRLVAVAASGELDFPPIVDHSTRQSHRYVRIPNPPVNVKVGDLPGYRRGLCWRLNCSPNSISNPLQSRSEGVSFEVEIG